MWQLKLLMRTKKEEIDATKLVEHVQLCHCTPDFLVLATMDSTINNIKVLRKKPGRDYKCIPVHVLKRKDQFILIDDIYLSLTF